jgi:hypothetical protein
LKRFARLHGQPIGVTGFRLGANRPRDTFVLVHYEIICEMQFHFHQHLCQSGILLCDLVFFISALAVVSHLKVMALLAQLFTIQVKSGLLLCMVVVSDFFF